LKALGDLEAITEVQTGGGVAIEYATAGPADPRSRSA
jgi:hypothetical protein